MSVINFCALKLSGVRSLIENQDEFISLSLLGNFSKQFLVGQYLTVLKVVFNYCHVLFKLSIVTAK